MDGEEKNTGLKTRQYIGERREGLTQRKRRRGGRGKPRPYKGERGAVRRGGHPYKGERKRGTMYRAPTEKTEERREQRCATKG